MLEPERVLDPVGSRRVAIVVVLVTLVAGGLIALLF